MVKVLLINSYAGSLAIGVSAAPGVEIIGSYEDTGFGIEIQKANFPDLEYVDKTPWPDRDLSDAIVIAHPPCSAFSKQQTANRKELTGIGADAFKCTLQVMDYAMRHKARALAIESVTGALVGAAAVHEQFAERHGYNIYRILQNAVAFGAPQWRERFWVVFIRKDLDHLPFNVYLEPNYKTVRQALEGSWDSPILTRDSTRLQSTIDNINKSEYDLTFEKIEQAFWDRPTQGRTALIAARILDLKVDNKSEGGKEFRRTITGYSFDSHQLFFVHPELYSPVLTWSSSWYLAGRGLITRDGYKQLMGFPRDYVFPEKRDYAKEIKKYLSKGVVPAIATWVLGLITRHLEHESVDPADGAFNVDLSPGGVADLRIGKPQFRLEVGFDQPIAPRAPRAPRANVERRTGDQPQPPRPPRPKAPRKKRVEGQYALRFSKDPTIAQVSDAFAPVRDVVLTPLVGLGQPKPSSTDPWTAIVQYEPPNAGGHAGDVDRIVERAARRLTDYGCEWKRLSVSTHPPTHAEGE